MKKHVVASLWDAIPPLPRRTPRSRLTVEQKKQWKATLSAHVKTLRSEAKSQAKRRGAAKA